MLSRKVAGTHHLPRLHEKLRDAGFFPLWPVERAVLQINVGKTCSQVCSHWHVGAGPDRKEIMTRATMQLRLDALAQRAIAVSEHCYGCTAGAGCGGTVA